MLSMVAEELSEGEVCIIELQIGSVSAAGDRR